MRKLENFSIAGHSLVTDDSSDDDADRVRVKVTSEKSKDYTEHTASLLNENGTPVREVTFDYMKRENGTVVLGDYVGLARSRGIGRSVRFLSENFLTFGTDMFALETTDRKQKTLTDEVTWQSNMDRAEAEKADNVEIIDDE